MLIATQGFLVDWVSSLAEEYQLLRIPITLPTVVYFLSRLVTLCVNKVRHGADDAVLQNRHAVVRAHNHCIPE
jgi:hypothetical protein